MKFTRRDFLKVSALSFCTLVISTGLSGCSSSSNSTNVSFLHGVASGDPTQNSVIIWTRLTPDAQLDSLNLSYEVSKLEDFSVLEHNGDVSTTKDRDYTVKIDLKNLEAGTTYYYRFISNEKTSIVGKTKTIATNPSQVKMAVFSCSNYPNGYFNAYMEASKIEDLDVALHLGDYIYEYGTYKEDDEANGYAYATSNAQALGRVYEDDNNTELLELDDYRKRYALYNTDEGSIALHKNVPFITVWDDHEIANDTYINGAENHDVTEGDFEKRKASALQAYFEWLPIRPFKEDNDEIVYRSFDFGNLVSLHMLDTRVIGRDEQLSYSNPSYYDNTGAFNASKFQADLLDSSRTLLGSEQLSWLQGKLTTSTATWQVLGQQVLMGKMFLPAEVLTLIARLSSDLTDTEKATLLAVLNTTITELVTLKLTDPTNARLTTVLPYNLDAWDGYFIERETVLSTAKALNKNLVVLSGDTHNSWASEIKDISGDSVAVEFAVSSVTSPGMEDYASLTTLEAAQSFEYALTTLIDDLKYTNLNQRGFMTVTFTNSEVITNWKFIDSNDSTIYKLDSNRETVLSATVGSNIIS